MAVAGDDPEHGTDLVGLVYFSLSQSILLQLFAVAVACEDPEHGADPDRIS